VKEGRSQKSRKNETVGGDVVGGWFLTPCGLGGPGGEEGHPPKQNMPTAPHLNHYEEKSYSERGEKPRRTAVSKKNKPHQYSNDSRPRGKRKGTQ